MKKREKFLYWFMGVGCGIMLSGLMMTYVGLNIRPQEVVQETVPKDEVEPIKPTTVVTIDEIKVKEETQEGYKWVNIPSDYSATQISEFLEVEGIIEDAMAFRSYVHEQEMTTKLLTGKRHLPLRGAYDLVLEHLTRNVKKEK